MPLRFFIKKWNQIKSFFRNLWHTIATHALSQGSQSFYQIEWTERDSVMIATFNDIRLHVLYVTKKEEWVWQLGNDDYYERCVVDSKEIAKESVVITAIKYHEWDLKHKNTQYFTDVVWKNDKSNGQLGELGSYDFWISPIDDTEQGLWRYDIYRYDSTKSSQYGVARSLNDARNACIRAVFALSNTKQ
jgi:hypothetical protein